MSAREVVARAFCVNPDRIVFDWPTADGGRHRVREWQQPANLDKADAILAALDAAGMQVVPKEPTRGMLNRGLEGADINWRAASEDEALSDDEVIRIYRAILAAAKEGER